MLRIAFQHERRRILLHSYRRLLSTTRSPYQVLDIPSSATKADVKKAYIEKAKKCHPDLFPDNEEKTKEFQELQEAYSILSDTKKRAEYAQMQRTAQGQAPASPRHPYTDYSGMSSRNNPYGNRYGPGAGRPKNDPLHDMMQEMLRAQQKHYQKFGSDFQNDASMRGRRWDRIIWRLVVVYIILWIFFGNLRLSAARQAEADPDKFAHRASLLNHFMAARMRDPRDPREEYLTRQREVRELMETYNGEDKKRKDDTMDRIDNDRPE